MNIVMIRTLIFTALLTLPMAATAAKLESAEHAYELPAAEVVTISPNRDGALVFKPCESCKAVRAMLSAETQFVINEEPVTRQVFRPAMRKSSGWVYVFISIETGKVRKIELDE